LLNQFKNVYESRWKASINTKDEDILVFENPKTQVEFFYLMYNQYIENIILNHFKCLTDVRLLEVGCGRATSSIYQAKKLGIDITPTDFSEAALAVASKNIQKYGINADPQLADIYALPFSDNSFDIVVSLGVMEHIAKAELAYQEMFRVLKPGGVVISMNVPEHQNIQKIATPVNKVLAFIEKLFSGGMSKPWLDKGSQSKTADVFRADGYAKDFMRHLENSGFIKVSGSEVNPFPTFSPLPRSLDWLVVKIYQAILFIRGYVYRDRSSFECDPHVSRCHFVTGIKSLSK